MRWLLMVWVLVGCGDAEDSSKGGDGRPKGACGEVTEHDVILRGLVQVDGLPAGGADVAVIEEAWHVSGRTYRTARTEADGTFEMALDDVVAVEDCWGTAISYVLYAELGELQGSRGINSSLFNAIDGGSGVADLSAIPLELR